MNEKDITKVIKAISTILEVIAKVIEENDGEDHKEK